MQPLLGTLELRLAQVPAALLLGAVLLRSLLNFRGTSALLPVSALLVTWTSFYLAESRLTLRRNLPLRTHLYLAAQYALTLLLAFPLLDVFGTSEGLVSASPAFSDQWRGSRPGCPPWR